MRISKDTLYHLQFTGRIGSPGTANQTFVANFLSPVYILDQFATDLVLGNLFAIDNHSNQSNYYV